MKFDRLHRREYSSWKNMIARCYDKSHLNFKRYGGRGITVCERWHHNFKNFYADMGDRPDGMTLDRYPNGKGNYEPGNCRWATHDEQMLNRRRVNQSSRFIGVIRRAGEKSWQAKIMLNGKQTYLGSFRFAVVAAFAYDDASVAKRGVSPMLNFPERIRVLQSAGVKA